MSGNERIVIGNCLVSLWQLFFAIINKRSVFFFFFLCKLRTLTVHKKCIEFYNLLFTHYLHILHFFFITRDYH